MTQRKTINSLQGLRAIMIGIVVLFHIFGINIIYGGGAEAMPFFFILSGFVLSMAFCNKKIKISIKEEVSFMKKRLKKIYPLYFFVITFLLIFELVFILKTKTSILSYLKRYIIDAIMVQSWSLNETIHYGLTGSTWFVSSLMFSYLIFLPFNALLDSASKKSKKAIPVLFVSLIILIATYQFIFKRVIVKESFYFTYFFPPYRAIEFITGMLAARLFIMDNNSKESKNIKAKYTVIECVLLLFFIVERIGLKYIDLQEKYDWRVSTFEVILMCALIFIFAKEKGYISILLSLKPLLWFASISFEVYLLHQPVQLVLGPIFEKLNFNSFNGIVVITVTIALAVIWNFAMKTIKKRKAERKIGE